jgi:hypothetical protein
MNIRIEDEIALVVKVANLDEKQSLISMHLSEIETEAEKTLELLSVARSHAFHNDTDATQETLAELVISLEHLSHHVNHALPELQRRLEIDIEQPTQPKTLRERPASVYTTKTKRGGRNGKKKTDSYASKFRRAR